ncbi:DNA topoisomerase 3-alpha [Bactrocera neohumeralis]|uniref:DNA topoisomerase 3-alpha n=1 Tax=Bactrocera neohumeralis TaxID=98809 RepID=UPI002165F2FB|nr:DNA topoisomerase 3-alpha [Bactrocera neohumeralis]
MAPTVLRVFLLMAIAMVRCICSQPPPWGIPGIKPEASSTTLAPTTTRAPTRGTCPEPTEELLACIRQWSCQYLIRLDLRCLLNLNGLPLIGNALGGLLGGGGGQSPTQQPALGGGGGGILGGSGGGLLGGPGGLLGGLLG